VSGRRSYVTAGIEDKVFDAALVNGVLIGQEDRRSRPLTLGYTARTETDTAVWGYNVDLAWNTGWGRNNDLASYRTEDSRIDTVRWKAVRGAASYSAPLATTWLWTARGMFQYSPDVLIAGEQFGIGGIGSVRGTELERPVTGDKGISGTLELTTPEMEPGWRLLGFVDAGYVRNNKPDFVLNPRSDRLASIGVGTRYVRGPFSLAIDYGTLVLGSRVPLSVNTGSPRKGDDRFYITLAYRL
jgi:hemolysin activation/secretion protein